MPDVVAKAMAVITGVLLVGVLALLYVTSRPPASALEVVAEFRDAFPMIEGMQLRTDGATSGSVGKIEISDEGLASITLLVDKTIPPPKANATAAIRQADTTGDSYISYDPGSGTKPLPEHDGRPTIRCAAREPGAPCANTLAAPRLDDLINAFGPPEQAGVKLILQQLSMALAQRGVDVNRAALDLLPALDAAQRAVDEVASQNTALKQLIVDMEDVSGQAASRRRQLARLVEGLASTLEATAVAAAPLDAGIRRLPATQAKLRTTFAELTRTAEAARPFAAELRRGGPQLDAVLDRAPAFIDEVKAAIREARPTLNLTRKLLVSGTPTIEADPQRVVTGSFDLAPALSNLLKGILGGDDTIKAFFGDDRNGAPEDRSEFGYGLGAALSEPGNQPNFPGDWTPRNFLRFGVLINCQTFGLPIGENCLADALKARDAKEAASGAATTVKEQAGAPRQERLDEGLRELVGKGGDPLRTIVDAVGDTGAGADSVAEHLEDLLDFLLKS